MRIRVLHFAAFREVAGRDEEEKELASGARIEELWAALCRDVEFFRRFPSMPPAAVNREYAAPETQLREGDEVAFLPPIAGG